ncbi:hypothetical protein DPEC_G00004870 [Dallia pectoralis]|uniref:Uncharacterized protein n=1 Tax=Dallia pectoralis TaxID=75939 RepID=A0ACC2HJL5_DALPE|nr:hypothetical protein DPEC_G00004870 [Dallia pectoralis]
MLGRPDMPPLFAVYMGVSSERQSCARDHLKRDRDETETEGGRDRDETKTEGGRDRDETETEGGRDRDETDTKGGRDRDQSYQH